MQIFISHSHSDGALADNLQTLARQVFGQNVTVNYSSSQGDGGIPKGAAWFDWIAKQVQQCDYALVILTPTSILKPWVMWEAGAVYGSAASGAREGGTSLVKVLRYRLGNDEIPGPFQQIESTNGTDGNDLRKMLVEIIDDKFPKPAENRRAVSALEASLPQHLKSMAEALEQVPLLPTEGVVQEWLSRLDALERERKYAEVPNLEQWLVTAFGRTVRQQGDGDPSDLRRIPLDIRIHRRLGEMHLQAKNYADAIAQFEVALEAAPRDLYLARKLGQALLARISNEKEAQERSRLNQTVSTLFAKMQKLDARVFSSNEENAALKIRWHRENSRDGEALDVARDALEVLPSSHYLNNLAAEACLRLRDEADAKKFFNAAAKIVEERGSRDIWSLATRANAALAHGRTEPFQRLTAQIVASSPSPNDQETINNGFRRIHEGLQLAGAPPKLPSNE